MSRCFRAKLCRTENYRVVKKPRLNRIVLISVINSMVESLENDDKVSNPPLAPVHFHEGPRNGLPTRRPPIAFPITSCFPVKSSAVQARASFMRRGCVRINVACTWPLAYRGISTRFQPLPDRTYVRPNIKNDGRNYNRAGLRPHTNVGSIIAIDVSLVCAKEWMD